MIAMNASQTPRRSSRSSRQGHVLFIDADSREPMDCIRTSVGAGGTRQVHFAIPSPDETYIAVANQNGKLFERINTDYATDTFVLDIGGGHQSGQLHDPRMACRARRRRCGPTTLRSARSSTRPAAIRSSPCAAAACSWSIATATPDADRRRVRHLDRHRQRVPGRRGHRGKMYIDSGGGTAANLFEADLYAFPVTGFSPPNPPNTPARERGLQRDRGRQRMPTERP